MKLYGEISKVEPQDDGTIKVFGFASSESVDSDGEVVTADAMKAALPDYMKYGAVREMHDAKKAAGTAIEADVQEDGKTWFGAHVVDSEAVKKVTAGVYKGFSIGGKITGRDELHKNIVTGVKLVEVSLVDRPANPEAVITIMKAEDIDDSVVTGAEGETKKADSDHDLTKYTGEQVMDAGRALDALAAIMYLFVKEQAEDKADAEQVAALAAVIANLKAFIASEIQEPDEPEQNAETIAMSAATDDIEKAGKEISTKNAEKLQAIHDHAVSMGAECAKCADKSATSDGDDRIQKVDDLQKSIDDLQKRYDEQAETITKQADRIKVLEAEPVAPKAFVGSGAAITKAEDAGGTEPKALVKNEDGTDNEAASLIKRIHQSGGVY